MAKAVKALAPVLHEIGGGQVTVHEQIAKLSVVGVGMKTHSGVAATLFQALADAGINIELISTSEIKISVIIALDRADEGARVAHAAFEPNQDVEKGRKRADGAGDR
jgi:aspartate kinase